MNRAHGQGTWTGHMNRAHDPKPTLTFLFIINFSITLFYSHFQRYSSDICLSMINIASIKVTILLVIEVKTRSKCHQLLVQLESTIFRHGLNQIYVRRLPLILHCPLPLVRKCSKWLIVILYAPKKVRKAMCAPTS